MSFDPEDPKWSAYVLGELDDDARAAIDGELAQSPDAQRFVDELRRTIDLISTELQSEPCPSMSNEELAPVGTAGEEADEEADPKRPLFHTIRPEGHRRMVGRGVILALAASLLAGIGIGSYLVAPGNWHIRDLKLAWKGKSQPTEAYHQTESDGDPLLDDSSLESDLAVSRSDMDDAIHLTPPSDGAPEVKLRLGDGSESLGGMGGGLGSPGGKKKRDLAFTVAKPTNETRTKYHSEADGLVTESEAWHDRRSESANRSGGKVPGALRAPRSGAEAPTADTPMFGQQIETKTRPHSYEYSTPYGSQSEANAESKREHRGDRSGGGGEGGGENKKSGARPNGKLVDRYNSLVTEGQYGEAKELAERGVKADPASPLAKDGRLNVNAHGESSKDKEIGEGEKELALERATDKKAPQSKPLAEPTQSELLDTQTLELATPKIILQEELESRLGVAAPFEDHSQEAYEPVTDNPFLPVTENPLSTFSIDVDTASYAIVRRYLQQNHQLPPPSAVRIEELVNYFRYDYPQPEEGKPFAANVEVAGCPWNAEHRLVRVGIKGREVARDHRPLTNLVFLIDVSGSMQSPDKLPLVKESMRLLAQQMGENDRVAIVVYAGSSGLVLPSTNGTDKQAILKSLDALEAGGSTNGAQGIQLAYDIAMANFIKGGVNRVILATDGDFNVGVTNRGDLVKLIEQKAASGVFLTTLGYGMGNLKNATLEQLADKGNGNYAYIDNLGEAKKVLVEQMSGTLVAIAKDVKIQIEFNPTQVAAFRLIGYENRILRHEDFNDDKKDAGEIGAGHTVTALYELVPAGKQPAVAAAEVPAAVDPLKYQQKLAPTDAAQTAELLTLKLRYKQPDGDKSQLLEYPVKDSGNAYGRATGDFKFAASVALFGMLLRDSPYKGTASFAAAHELAQEGRGSDPEGYRSEFIQLIDAARAAAGGVRN